MKKLIIAVLFASVTIVSQVSAFPGGKSKAPPLEGTVAEVLDAGNYTYLRLKMKGKSMWVAIPQTDLKKGARVKVNAGMEMGNFESKRLKRTFKRVIFSSGLVGQKSKRAKAKHGKGSGSAKGNAEVIKVKKAKGKNAYTVAEVHKNSDRLAGKNVIVRGKIVKVSENIMSRNWIHIQDGSGQSSDGTNDLLFTSKEVPSVGKIVTLKGVVLKDQDFGSGYFYKVLIGKAVQIKKKH
jgi:hypothetical protein